MTTEQINKGKELLKDMADRNNLTVNYAEVNMNLFLNKLGIDLVIFIKGMRDKIHPFTICRGSVMMPR